MKITSINPLLQSWRINKLLGVPSIANELNASLPNGWCHHNVCNLQRKLGGNTVLGFLVCEMDDHFWCLPHSIWKHNELGYLDVTLKTHEELLFAPVVEYDCNQSNWIIQQEYRFYKNTEFGVDIMSKSKGIKKFTSDEFASLDSTFLLLKRDYLIFETESWDDYLDELSDYEDDLCN